MILISTTQVPLLKLLSLEWIKCSDKHSTTHRTEVDPKEVEHTRWAEKPVINGVK